ncbi:ABC transporter ATP-binding protein [Nocardioides oleivorans]|uniref:ABC transporter ATP-binding protein n=1 Tax=Nocardioides oleivorans TaxID=273676 RepID=A0A4Q2S3V2_9ACTN|nr:ABC transporter ATP-binding protein [Nocardioides oleivorans]RYB95124.1 ABC transporter ATP-binding protein [Nocardioides oleivorans]
MIRTEALTKRFGRVTAVDAVDLEVREGDVYGFLGANGSGKTTTVRMLLGLVLATSGSIDVLDESMPGSARSVLPRVGAMVEGPGSYPHLSGRANLASFDATGADGQRRTRGRRIEEALERVGLASVDKRPVRAYSLGMRQRLGLAAAILRRPSLLVLDEPTNGLDPQGINEIRTLLLELNREGTTVFLSSHLLGEIEQMCTRVGVLDGGRLVLQDQMDALRGPTGRTEVHTPDPEQARRLLTTTAVEIESTDDASGARLLVRGLEPADLNARLVEGGVRVTQLSPERRRLEDVVLAATTSGTDRFGRDGVDA